MTHHPFEVVPANAALVSNYESLRNVAIHSEKNVLSEGIGLAVLRFKGFANLITMWSSLSASSSSCSDKKYKVTEPIVALESVNNQVTSLLASMIIGKGREQSYC